MKVETDIIASIAASLIEGAVILVIMYVQTFKTDTVVFISIEHHVVTLTDIFQYQCQSVDTDSITQWDQRTNFNLPKKICIYFRKIIYANNWIIGLCYAVWLVKGFCTKKTKNKNSTFLGFAYLYVCICVWENISNYNVFIYQQITTRIFLWIKIQVKTLLTSIINTLYIYMYIEAVDWLIDWLID